MQSQQACSRCGDYRRKDGVHVSSSTNFPDGVLVSRGDSFITSFMFLTALLREGNAVSFRSALVTPDCRPRHLGAALLLAGKFILHVWAWHLS